MLAVVVAVLWFLHWFRRTPPRRISKVLRRAALYGAIGVLVLMVATGRLNPLFAALAAAVPVLIRAVNLLRMLPALQQVLQMLGISGIPGVATGGGNPGRAGQTSSIRTPTLEMTLDHMTGAMDGLVLEGAYRGRRLSELTLEQLLDFLVQCRAGDPQSAALLEAYLDRAHGDTWRDAASDTGARAPGPDAGMTRDEALAILGLRPDATSEEIRDAHRRLMQRFHPDRGGSDYLAAKINEAKRLLLDDQ